MTISAPITPRVYVGTYHKYNCGSIAGKWIDLDDYPDSTEFYDACREIHRDEPDPEIMFQDFEGFPESFYSESSIDDDVFEWIELDDDQKDIVEAYRDNIDSEATFETALDKFCGRYDDAEDYAYEYVESTGMFSDVPETIQSYFDYKAFGRDLVTNMSFVEHNGEFYAFDNY